MTRRGYIWAYLNYYDYCERRWSHWGGVNSAEYRNGRRIYYWGSRMYDYDFPCPNWYHYQHNYLRWLRYHARIRYIGYGWITDIRGRSYWGDHYVIDLPRVLDEFNNDTTPGHPPIGQRWYDPEDYPPNKRMVPVTLEDITNEYGVRFLDLDELPEDTYNFWKERPAVRAELGKFGCSLAFDPVAFGLSPYPEEVEIRFGLMRFDEYSWRVSQGGGSLQNANTGSQGPLNSMNSRRR
jgi:hypothetical protein